MTGTQFTEHEGRIGPPDGRVYPRFMGPTTYSRLPRIDEVSDWDVAVVGAPFDIGTSYRPGARFGPIGIRHGARTIRSWHPDLERYPFGSQQVVDAAQQSLDASYYPGAENTALTPTCAALSPPIRRGAASDLRPRRS